MIYIISLSVFSGIIMSLVILLLLLEAVLVKKGDRFITINGSEESKLKISGTPTVLSALVGNGILLPSACGGGGSCGMCKCVITEGGGDILPTELAHLSRKEKMEKVRLGCQVKVKNDMGITIPEEIFNIKKYKGTVVSNNSVATFIKELVVELEGDDEMICEAGSYIQIDVPEYEIAFKDFDIPEKYREDWDHYKLWQYKGKLDEPIFRAYSLANPPSEKKRLVLTVRIDMPAPWIPDIPPGQGSTYIFNLKAGDTVAISGPYGDFFVKDTDREMCFVGGGAGMAPMRCHIFHQFLTLNTHRNATFWYGARSKREMFYHEEFLDIEKKSPNFTYHVALSDPKPEDQWTGYTGFIHQVLHDKYLSTHKDPTEIEYYLCGPPLMIDSILSMLDSLGVEEDMIHFDKF
ncbi:MAG: NADH:ubiquinone reductase (Na(+)-transporting) subunit F [Proteobacteria bacterium]|nr:NADH:ubiquinone reductase (Na(+)-transporting) subunit F [Pseudomonadota bacterium]